MIKIFRGALILFLLSVFGVGALFMRFCIFPFQKNKEQNYETLQKSWIFFVWLLKITAILKININDYEKIKSIRNSIIVSTHPSFADILILMSIIPHSSCFVAEKLARNPFFKGMVELLFIVDVRSTAEWLEGACEKLQAGYNVIIFPMGTRHRKNEFPKIRRGAALIAQKSKKNIVILKMKTSYEFLQRNQPVYDAGYETVIYDLNYITELDIMDYLEKYPDEVTFKTVVTKEISETLYGQK